MNWRVIVFTFLLIKSKYISYLRASFRIYTAAVPREALSVFRFLRFAIKIWNHVERSFPYTTFGKNRLDLKLKIKLVCPMKPSVKIIINTIQYAIWIERLRDTANSIKAYIDNCQMCNMNDKRMTGIMRFAYKYNISSMYYRLNCISCNYKYR